ncbi:hypothetical protein KUL49_24390 [Alteromonas sp. KUL49]|nr:hypothetical protein KUL49_24390 [Alteromonas sp. KUL49]
MGKDFRHSKSDWEDNAPSQTYKQESEKRKRKLEQQRKAKLRLTPP